MKVQRVGSTNNITEKQEAKRWVQNHARICYSEKSWDELLNEAFMPGLMGNIIENGHHSPFDHFGINFYFDGPEKSLAMMFNNQGMYTTSEKSARYTTMKDIPDHQKKLFEKWGAWFLEEIEKKFPEKKFPTLYTRRKPTEKNTAEKLAQENARYVTSVFTPTKMTHSLTWRQMNILYHQFNDFIHNNEGSPVIYRARLTEAMKEFVQSDEIKNWVIEEAQVKMKGNMPLRFFKNPVEEYFGEDIYSTNYNASFASLAQLHRHRLVNYTVSDGFQQGAPLGVYVPRLVEAAGKTNEWTADLNSVANYDFPQGQLLRVGERGMRENLPARTEERECGLSQLETTRVIEQFLDRYAKHVPEIAKLKQPTCLSGGCKKGRCTFGPGQFLERLI